MRIAATLLIAALALTACSRAKPAEAQVAEGQANQAAADAFLAKNATAPGVHVTASGLQYQVIARGPADGTPPKAQDEVKVNYEGKLLSGKVFDSSFQRGEPASFPLDAVIAGWTEGLQLMRPGDEFVFWVPPKLGYGDEDKGDGQIPADSLLIFRVQLLGVLPR